MPFFILLLPIYAGRFSGVGLWRVVSMADIAEVVWRKKVFGRFAVWHKKEDCQTSSVRQPLSMFNPICFPHYPLSRRSATDAGCKSYVMCDYLVIVTSHATSSGENLQRSACGCCISATKPPRRDDIVNA